LAYDPYLADITLFDPVSDEESSVGSLTDLFQLLKEAGETNPALTVELVNSLDVILGRLRQERSKQLRERFIRLYKMWICDDGFPVPDGIENPILFRRGKIAEILVYNIERCNDGLSSFLYDQEMAFSNTCDKPLTMGMRLAHALVQYKKKFLDMHKIKNPQNQAEIELNTEARALAYQRLRLPLGLPGVYCCPVYSPMGRGDSEVFSVQNMIFRFLYGGTISFGDDRETSFLPFSLESVCEFLNELVNDRDDRTLTLEVLNDYLLCDSILKRAGDQVFIDGESNAYCDAFVEANKNPYKPKIWERILALHGYVCLHDPKRDLSS